MAMILDSGARSGAVRSTNDPKAWRPGMVFISVTGRRTSNPADVPGTPEYIARQQRTSTNRLTGGHTPVPTAPPPTPRPASTQTFGAVRAPAGPDPAVVAAQQAEAAARSAANNSARSGATQQKNQLQQAIDAALAQKQVNQGKMDALLGMTQGGGLARGRDTSLTAIDRDLTLLLRQAKAQYKATVGDLQTGLRDNENAEADSSFGNLSNRARESQDLVTAALAQGAGESDVLKAQLQSLRNWAANQGEINRGYFDTQTSTNAAITDLNNGTKTTMTGYEMDANQRRGGIWQDFYGGLADANTQLDTLAGNQYLLDREVAGTRANMGTQDALIAHINAGGNAEDFKAQPIGAAPVAGYDGTYAKRAAGWAGKAWENPGISQGTKDWTGRATVDAGLNNTEAWSVQKGAAGRPASKRPEGATLRKW